MRNPRSKFSFLNYLHAIGRLDQFVNMGSFAPYRHEVADYLKWAAESLSLVGSAARRGMRGHRPVWTGGTLTGWAGPAGRRDTIRSRYLAIGIGRDAHIPEPLRGLKRRRASSTAREYLQRIGAMRKDLPYRVAVVGARAKRRGTVLRGTVGPAGMPAHHGDARRSG